MLPTFVMDKKKTTYLNSYLLQSKPTLYYTLTKWCGGNIEDFLEIESTLKANKQKFKFILLTDSLCVVDLKIGRIIQSLSLDSIIYLNYKYPLCLNSLKEKKEFTKALNEKDQVINEKDQALIEKDQRLIEKDQVLNEKDQIIADLLKKLDEKK